MTPALAIFLLTAPAPVIVKDTKGQNQCVIGDAKSKATVTFVVMKDCPIARKYTPEINRIISEYQMKGVHFFMVFCEQIKSTEVNAHLKEFGISAPGIIDPGVLRQRTGAVAVPTASVFDRIGRRVYTGRIDDRFPKLGTQRPAPIEHDLRRALDQLLAGKPVSPAKTTVIGCSLPSL